MGNTPSGRDPGEATVVGLMDVEMPNLDGPALCAELRKLPQHHQTPVVFVTAIGEFERRQTALRSGGTDLLAKPFLPLELAVKALTWLLRAAAASVTKP